MTHFVFCPLSGDRVFAERAAPSLVIVQWRNLSRHVYGGVKLSYCAVGAHNWVRLARTLTASVVRAVGGVAWQNGDMVNLVIPAEEAWNAD
jgi:hypothetical protein